MNRIIEKDRFICPYCQREVKVKIDGIRQKTCNHCFHETRITITRKGFMTLQKTRQNCNNRKFKIDRTLYKDVIYTITDAELLKYNFFTEKITFEEFFESCHKKEFSGIRDVIVYKAYILGLPSVDIMEFFRQNGAKLNSTTITTIIKNYHYETKYQRIRNNLQRIPSQLE